MTRRLFSGIKNSFVSKVEAAIASIASGNTLAACGDLQALATAVQAQAGKALTGARATDLLADITRIRMALGCA